MKTYANIKYAVIALSILFSVAVTQAMAEVDWFELNRSGNTDNHQIANVNGSGGNTINREEYVKGQVAGIQAADFCPVPEGPGSTDLQARAASETSSKNLVASNSSGDFVKGYRDGYESTFKTNATYCIK